MKLLYTHLPVAPGDDERHHVHLRVRTRGEVRGQRCLPSPGRSDEQQVRLLPGRERHEIGKLLLATDQFRTACRVLAQQGVVVRTSPLLRGVDGDRSRCDAEAGQERACGGRARIGLSFAFRTRLVRADSGGQSYGLQPAGVRRLHDDADGRAPADDRGAGETAPVTCLENAPIRTMQDQAPPLHARPQRDHAVDLVAVAPRRRVGVPPGLVAWISDRGEREPPVGLFRNDTDGQWGDLVKVDVRAEFDERDVYVVAPPYGVPIHGDLVGRPSEQPDLDQAPAVGDMPGCHHQRRREPQA
ncbi:hypothetical protein OHA25_13645 [Nonomuraea sp. NBC_00507]|uniref:hypothetical protein n=1 Tax=Nonomuraea sp. NBC_00507 TaxID=2976002 RepID=UPI002E188676